VAKTSKENILTGEEIENKKINYAKVGTTRGINRDIVLPSKEKDNGTAQVSQQTKAPGT